MNPNMFACLIGGEEFQRRHEDEGCSLFQVRTTKHIFTVLYIPVAFVGNARGTVKVDGTKQVPRGHIGCDYLIVNY